MIGFWCALFFVIYYYYSTDTVQATGLFLTQVTLQKPQAHTHIFKNDVKDKIHILYYHKSRIIAAIKLFSQIFHPWP